MSMNDDIKTVLVSEEQLKAKVAELGARISKDYEGKNLVLVSILKGSVVFMADLMRAVTIPCNIDFMVVSSYGGSNTVTSGLVKIIKDLDGDLSGKDVTPVSRISSTISTSLPDRSSPITRASRCRTNSWWAMAWTTTKSTATCPMWACSSPRSTRSKSRIKFTLNWS